MDRRGGAVRRARRPPASGLGDDCRRGVAAASCRDRRAADQAAHVPGAAAAHLTGRRRSPSRLPAPGCAGTVAGGSPHFRAGVVIVVRHPDLRRILAFERADVAGQLAAAPGRAGRRRGRRSRPRGASCWRRPGSGPSDVVARAEYPGVGRRTSGPPSVTGTTHRRQRGSARCSAGSCSTPLDGDIAADARRQRVHRVAVGRPALADRPRGRLAARDAVLDARCCGDPVSDLFSAAAEDRLRAQAPLAARLRPRTLDDVVGQEHLVGPGKPLRTPGRAGPADERDLLGTARHRQDDAGAGRRRHARSARSSR